MRLATSFRRHLREAAANAPQTPTPLAIELHRQIRFHGPLTVADYMRACLTHPTYGYYTTKRSILGPKGDFTTSPQISPIFGELLAVWMAHHHSTTPTQLPYHLVELGPGTASLLASALPALRTLQASPASVTLVERSAPLQATQSATLSAPTLPPVSWASSLAEVLATPAPPRRIFLLNEFLDALPVHAFQRTPEGAWRERLVDINPAAPPSSAALRFVLAPAPTPATALLRAFPPADGAVAEVGAEAAATAEALARAVRDAGGAALLIDYGADGGGGDSVRAYARHAQVDVLARPGEADMTADVDFAQIRAAVERVGGGVVMRGPVSQRRFLLSLGAAARFRAVAGKVVEKGEREGVAGEVVDRQLERLQADYERLVGVGEMGERFKVAVVVREGDGEVAGGF